ncbi:unnamed protein product [Urochloa decumbens]|uniref:FAD-binding domain-containing protein n=1 Tax=Urochloa decumbens TaxID=240449 RepID=A0ABC9E050_9POAL
MEELHGIVIVGGGISGLATALALHRKGISSLVLERSETLRTDGVCISVHANGWRALDQLGIGTELRETANSITGYQNVWLKQKKTTLQSTSTEIRCLKQKDLIEALAKPLPPGTIRFGCHVAAISADTGGHCTLISTVDGSTIKAKALIGCDGVKSEVAKYLGLGIASELPRLTILGIARYPHGHPYGTQLLQLRGEELIVGRVPLNENLVHFFISRPSPSKDIDATAAKEYVLEKLKDQCPADIIEMVCDPEKERLKTLTRVWYRPPWQMLFGRFQMGTVVVAGDAMHAMGPFIGQAGSAALEDAVVLARSVSRALPGGVDVVSDDREVHEKISAALGKYVRERRTRVFMLSLEAFVTGSLLTAKALAKYLVLVPILIILGSESRRNANYDCGRL